MADTIASWRNFYELLGTASATMIALLFVAATVGAGVFTPDRRAPVRMFLSASVVHFSGILAVSLIVMSPLQSQPVFGSLVIACGLFGLAYYAATWRDTVRDGMVKRIDLEDRIWYAFLPVGSYLFETASGAALTTKAPAAWPALALSIGLLLIVGIHNAWDITIWSITRRRE